jgi:hypothetical protein
MADGLLPVQQEVESSWMVTFLYPLRGAESLAVIAAIGVIAWIFTILVPEYCIQVMKDASSMGAWLMGMLFVLIAILPSLFLGPLFLSYWLQYLGRVLVSTAMGDCVPPRTPDRNFDGLFNGLSPWLIWLGLGLVVGLSPALWWTFSGGPLDGNFPWLSMVVAAACLPYVLAALMLSFLHDHPIAATPWGVLYGLARLGPSFLVLSGLIAGTLGLVAGGLAMTLWIRAHLFWPYLLIALVWWVVFLWIQMVAMRLLGVFYFHRKDSLRWNRAHPRWGVAWRL